MNRFLTGDLRILMIRYTLNQWLLVLEEVRTIFKECFSERLKEYYMELKTFMKQAGTFDVLLISKSLYFMLPFIILP